MSLKFVKFLLLLACPVTIFAQQVSIIPQPVELKLNEGNFSIDKNTTVQFNTSQAALKPAVDFFLNAVKDISGIALQQNKPAAKKVEFILAAQTAFKPEAYSLTVTPSLIQIKASSYAGIFYGIQSVLQTDAQKAFAQQIALAKQLDLTLVIHTRNAWPDTFDVLDGEGMPERVVFHCFTGDEAEARQAVQRGAWLSFSGIVTFNKADDIRRAAKFCPADKLLTETDAPWLTPVPHRGKENEPAHVRLVGECLAHTRGESVATVAQSTVANAHRAFPGISR